MNDSILLRRKKRESLITFSFTLFSVFLAFVSMVADWTSVIIPVIAAELSFVWWAYVTQFRNYETRAILTTLMSCVNIIFYGVHAVDFYVIIPTLCVFTVLFCLYQMQATLNIVIVCNLFLMFYHLVDQGGFGLDRSDSMALNRAVLQLLSFVVLNCLCIYTVQRHDDEEKELSAMEAEVKRTRKIKDDFVANTSHELRTPIHTISGMSEILLQEDLPDQIHREVLDIQMTGIELQTIITDILDYAALESGTLEFSPRPYNITSTLNDIMNMTVYQNREKKLDLIFDCDSGIPCLMMGDEGQIRRVINNLIGNAIKFTQEGGLTVTVTSRKEDYGVNLIVRVKDTGIGMGTDELEQIFQDFYQADPDRNRTAEGMGLGLTICAAIIKKMGGFMTVRSHPGKGSEFAFSVPQQVVDERPCIALDHPADIRALWYFNEEKADPVMRDDIKTHIRNMSSYLGIVMQRVSSLSECKRRVRQMQYSHLLTGLGEYREDPLYFDELALQMPVLIIADRDETLPAANHLHILYKPYNAMTLAEIFNGGEILHNPRKYQETRTFVAPDAKILAVDDNVMNLRVVEGLLSKYRIRITGAGSGEEALTLIESRDYDFVFMDHMMPGMDGIECFRRIRSKQGSNYYAKVPVIALTANAIAGSREMFLEEGFNDFVAKPIDNALLDQILKKYIPEEKQIYDEAQFVSADDTGRQEKTSAADGDFFAQMEGIDMETALAYCGGSIDDYIDLANVYRETGSRYYPQLITCYESKDWKNYTILTHAIKSTSRTIGATKLSEIAYREETASREEDEATIMQYHQAMLDEYDRVLTLLKNNPRIRARGTQEEALPPADALKTMSRSTWKRVMTSLKKSLETYETDAVTAIIDRYRKYEINHMSAAEVLRPVQEKVEAFDFEGAKQVLEEIGGKTDV